MVDPRSGARTLEDVATEWLASSPSKRPSTLATERSHLRVHLIPALGATAVNRITKRDVQTLVNTWSGHLSARTVRRIFGTLNAIGNYAVDHEILVRSPTRGVKLPTVISKTRRLPTPEQLAALAFEVGTEYAPLIYLGAVLGLRWGECAGLRIGRIDFDRSTLTVAEQMTRGEHGEPRSGPPKSGAGNRTLSVPTPLVDLLGEHITRRGLTADDTDEFVLAKPEGGPLVYQNFRNRHWLPACRAVGLDGLGFHDLRRLNATGLVMEGVDVKTAQSRLGHSDPRLTLAVYAQSTTEADRSAADRLGARFMAIDEPSSGLQRCGRVTDDSHP